MDSDNKSREKITILMDGPYEVPKSVPLNQAIMRCDESGASTAWEKGREYKCDDGEAVYHLCRCGHSKNKPYCDGSHEDAGFCGRERHDQPAYADAAELQRGGGVDMLDAESLCVGARFCDVGKRVWNYVDQSDDPECKEMAIREACSCPGGRLTIVDKKGKLLEPNLPKEVSAVEDSYNDFRGPIWVKGGIPVEDQKGHKYEVRNRVALCRCGESSNQPYCDGSHYNCEHMRGVDG